MDDDQTSIRPRSGQGSRGPTRLKRLALKRVVGEKTRIDIDVNTVVALGPNADEFMSYLGVVSRERLSILINSVRKYGFKLEGGEWFKEGFRKLLSQE